MFAFRIFVFFFLAGVSRLTCCWLWEDSSAYLLGDEDFVDGADAGDGDALLLAKHRRRYEDHCQRQVAPA